MKEKKPNFEKCKTSTYQSLICFGCFYARECLTDAIKKGEEKLKLMRMEEKLKLMRMEEKLKNRII